MLPWLQQNSPFPPVTSALADPNGLLAAGADLSPERLLSAYQQGIFPWYSAGQPILWWSPNPRMVLRCAEFHCQRALRKRIRQCLSDDSWAIHCDSAFAQVIQHCAQQPRVRQAGTWITAEMIAAYQTLHQQGHAHSFETWQQGKLVAGLYGIAIGRMFYGESMFTQVTDGSKLALAALIQFLKNHGCELLDCQQETPHLATLGGAPISRSAFIQHLQQATQQAPMTWPRGNVTDYLQAYLT